MGKYKFIVLRNQFGILGLEYSRNYDKLEDSAKELADEITFQEEHITDISFPCNGKKTEYHKVNRIYGLRFLISYFERKLENTIAVLDKLKEELSLAEQNPIL